MNDHPHHHSLWFTHGDVNGRDFWTEHKETALNSEIKHREFVETTGGDVGRIVTRNDWISDGAKVLEDERTLVFGEDEFGRYIDFEATLHASEGDVTFGETKEGSFGVRANAALTVDAKQGAKLVNSRGATDAGGPCRPVAPPASRLRSALLVKTIRRIGDLFLGRAHRRPRCYAVFPRRPPERRFARPVPFRDAVSHPR